MTLDAHGFGEEAQGLQLDVLARLQRGKSSAGHAPGTPGQFCLTEPARFTQPDKFLTEMLTHEGTHFKELWD